MNLAAPASRPFVSGIPTRLVAGGAVVCLLVAVALLSMVWTPGSPTRMAIAQKLRPPLDVGLLGTDQLGRDVLSILMVGTQNSLGVALLAVALGAFAGTLLGMLAAARGGWAEEAAMRACDVVFAFPPIVSAMMLGAILGPGRWTAVVAIAVFMVPVFARVARSAALLVWSRDYVLAARGAGKGPWRITFVHVLPNIAGQVVVQITIQLGLAILTESGLSFLGLGAPPPTPSWGRMLADAQVQMFAAPWLAILPGATIALAVLGLNLLGDGLRDLLDPRRGLGQ